MGGGSCELQDGGDVCDLGFLSLVCAESGEVEVVHRERAEVAELAAVEVVGEEVTGVELVRAAVAEAKVAEEDDRRRSHREVGLHETTNRWRGTLGRTNRWATRIVGPHKS